MPMKKGLFISALILLLVSCTKSIDERRAFVAFHRIEEAESLYTIGKTEEANSLLDEVINQNNEMEHPTTMQRLRWAIFSDVDKEEGSLYYDYIFLYMAQIEAIATKNKHEDNPLKRIETMKRLFTLAPDFEIVIENYLNWEAIAKKQKTGRTQTYYYDAAYSVYNPFKNKYNKYIGKIKGSYGFAGDRWELPLYLYRAKWGMMGSLLIESDRELGYEKTFAYFDSILEDHGACFQEYTKALVKSYMSFSGLPKYEYETDMGYEEFKTIVADPDRWYTTWAYESKGKTFINSGELNLQSGGFLLECDGKHIWNPSKMDLPYLFFEDDTLEFSLMDGQEMRTIKTGKEEQAQWYASTVNVPKPLLCALLYRHGLGTIVPRVLESKQYIQDSVLVREGEENGYKKVVHYKDNREIEWRLYNMEGQPVCDSMGTHCQRVEDTEDSTITYYLGTDMLMREKKPAFEVDPHNGKIESHYYDRQNNLYKKLMDDTVTYYKNNDSLLITIKCNFETDFTVVTTEFLNCLDSTNRPIKEVIVYNDWYDEEEDQQLGDIVLIQHPLMDCSNPSDSLKWPFEQRWYDEQHRVNGIAYYDNNKVFQGGLRYLYKDDGTIIVYHYNSNNWLYQSETIFEEGKNNKH